MKGYTLVLGQVGAAGAGGAGIGGAGGGIIYTVEGFCTGNKYHYVIFQIFLGARNIWHEQRLQVVFEIAGNSMNIS